MHKQGHWGVSMLLYAPFVYAALSTSLSYLPYALLGALIVSSFCMLPDVDLTLQQVSIPILGGLPIKHRGITHTVWFALLVGGVFSGAVAGIFWLLSNAGIPLPKQIVARTTLTVGFVGWFSVTSHILGDVITPMGVKPFYPISGRKYTLSLVQASNSAANHTLQLLGGASVGLSFLMTDPKLKALVFGII